MPRVFRELQSHPRAVVVFILAAVSFLCFLPALFWGPPTDSADLTHHVQIANAYASGVEHGTLLPDWVYPENQGYGSVAVRFYPPLIHLTIAAFKTVLHRMDWAFFAAFSLWSMIGCWGMYLWTRDIVGGTVPALAGALLFAISPYHLNQFYNSFMLGEFVSLSVLPFAFFFIRRLCRDGGSGNVIGLAVAFGGLILSNIPQAVVCFPFLGIYALFCIERKRSLTQLGMLAASAATAAALTSFYWVRMIAEMSWIHISEPNTDPNYDFRNNFLFSAIEVGPEGVGFGSIMASIMVALVLVLLFASGRYRTILRERQMSAVLVIMAASNFMLLPVSRLVWETFDVLQRVQFPWRFLSVASLAASLVLAYSIAGIDRESIGSKRPVVLIMIGGMLILATFSVKQVILGAVFSDTATFNNYAAASVNRNGLYHWWPIWADKNTFKERTRVLAGQREVTIASWDAQPKLFSISAGEPATVRTAILYYPWWHAVVNGADVEAKNVGGALGFDVGSESAECLLQFREPSYTKISRGVSLASILIIAFIAATGIRRSKVSYE